jgi:hypothetical protein
MNNDINISFTSFTFDCFAFVESVYFYAKKNILANATCGPCMNVAQVYERSTSV